MRSFDIHWLMEGVARQMRREALLGQYDGLAVPRNASYMNRCTAVHVATGSKLIFTRDIGMHSSGWWKNPDYERCWHLSLSFVDPISGENAPQDHTLAGRWVEAFYGNDKVFVWVEPPYSPNGRVADVYHYRVFCDPAWQPILPRGEVYSREFTERGWKSFSELQNARAKELQKLVALPGEQ